MIHGSIQQFDFRSPYRDEGPESAKNTRQKTTHSGQPLFWGARAGEVAHQ